MSVNYYAHDTDNGNDNADGQQWYYADRHNHVSVIIHRNVE
jgi:hypothetical protein